MSKAKPTIENVSDIAFWLDLIETVSAERMIESMYSSEDVNNLANGLMERFADYE